MASWFDALWGRIFTGGVEQPLPGGLNFTGAIAGTPNDVTGLLDVDVIDGSIGPDQTLIVSNGIGIPFVLPVVLTAGTPGTADDVTVFAANAPYGLQIVDVWATVTTGISSKTVTLRSASGGGGSALSAALDFGTSSTRVRDSLGSAPSVAKGGSLYVRRSDRGVAGTVFVLVLKTSE